jgi:hypothetical protein
MRRLSHVEETGCSCYPGVPARTVCGRWCRCGPAPRTPSQQSRCKWSEPESASRTQHTICVLSLQTEQGQGTVRAEIDEYRFELRNEETIGLQLLTINALNFIQLSEKVKAAQETFIFDAVQDTDRFGLLFVSMLRCKT